LKKKKDEANLYMRMRIIVFENDYHNIN